MSEQGSTIRSQVYLYICLDRRISFLYFEPRIFMFALVDPVPNFTKQNLWSKDLYPWYPSVCFELLEHNSSLAICAGAHH